MTLTAHGGGVERVRRSRSRRRRWIVGIVVAIVAVSPIVTPAAAGPSPGPDARTPAASAWSGKWPSAGVPTTEQLQALARSRPPAASTAGGAELLEAAEARLRPCADDPTFFCGTLPVPLDRRNPDGRMVDLHVEVFPHTGPQRKADGAVFITCGGPGCAISAGLKYGYAFFVLPEVAQARDLVFVDQRGVGLSDAIDCPALQAGGPFYSSSAGPATTSSVTPRTCTAAPTSPTTLRTSAARSDTRRSTCSAGRTPGTTC